MSSSSNSNENFVSFKITLFFSVEYFRFFKYKNFEAKRRQNIEDNRRFLAALKINDVSYV